jgi:branched-chain amino acid transport system ATP-binding protein
MLSVRGIDCYYGKMHVLREVSVEVGTESVGMFGPNGAGKTTLINAILGLVKPRKGEISFDGKPILGLPTHEIARLGISLVPQDRELFPFMSVGGNLELGSAYIPGAATRTAERLELVFGLFPVLQQRMRQAAGTLSGGEQRMLAVARALMASPRLLILDEPSLGLQPSLVTELFARLAEMRRSLSILVTEQNVRSSLKAIDRGYVLENGSIAFQDTAEGLSKNPHVVKSYLGL